MVFRLPTFNLIGAVWHDPFGTLGPPDDTFTCNLALGRRVAEVQESLSGGNPYTSAMWLLTPPGVDLRCAVQAITFSDAVEVPFGSGRFYAVVWVDDAGKGFPNEHRVAGLRASNSYGSWPVPMP